MKNRKYNDTFYAAFVLLGTAAAAMLLATLTGRGDITSATLILCSLGCFMGGLFLLTLNREEPLDTRLFSLLPVQGTIDIATLCADLGMQGNAGYVPIEGEVREIIPASAVPSGDYSYIPTKDGYAVQITPTCAPLLRDLKKRHGLEIPSDERQLFAAVRETCEDLLELAEHCGVERDSDNIVVSLQGFRLAEGCREVHATSPKCCTMVACPVCSLIVCMLAEGLGETLTISRTSLERDHLRLVISPLSRDGDHGNSQ